jgi:hypothetical protein
LSISYQKDEKIGGKILNLNFMDAIEIRGHDPILWDWDRVPRNLPRKGQPLNRLVSRQSIIKGLTLVSIMIS